MRREEKRTFTRSLSTPSIFSPFKGPKHSFILLAVLQVLDATSPIRPCGFARCRQIPRVNEEGAEERRDGRGGKEGKGEAHHRLTVTADDTDRSHVLQDVFRRDRLGANAGLGKGDVFGCCWGKGRGASQ